MLLSVQPCVVNVIVEGFYSFVTGTDCRYRVVLYMGYHDTFDDLNLHHKKMVHQLMRLEWQKK